MLGPRCLYYALGGGLGHGVRSLALARQLQRQIGGQHRLLWNSSFAPTLQCALNYESELEASILSANAPPHHAGEFLAAEVRSFQPDLLVVDTFPRGLGGELVQILPDLNRRSLAVSLVVAHRRNLSRRVRAFMKWVESVLAPHFE